MQLKNLIWSLVHIQAKPKLAKSINKKKKKKNSKNILKFFFS
jgi:hypothetical protein